MTILPGERPIVKCSECGRELVANHRLPNEMRVGTQRIVYWYVPLHVKPDGRSCKGYRSKEATVPM